jgi:hypothetical protein
MLAEHIQIQEIKEDQEVLEVEAAAQHPLLKEDRVDHQRLVKVLEEEMVVTLPIMVVEVSKQVLVLDTKLVAVAERVLEDKIFKTLIQQ